MNNPITVTGLVATDPRYPSASDTHYQSNTNLFLTFRFASTSTDISVPTNWYTVIAEGALAENMSRSIAKGNRIIVTGDLRIRDWDNGQTSGMSVEIIASAVGHDLNYGVSDFSYGTRTSNTTTEEHTCTCEYHNA